MTVENRFDFGMNSHVNLLDQDHHSSGVESIAHQIRHLQLDTAKEPQHINTSDRRRRDSVVTNFSFDLPASPASAISSTTSLHSGLHDHIPLSSYWRIPDRSNYLTSIAVHEESQLVAIGSGASEDNLFIYEVYPDEVTHHQTVSLPEIHSLKWASPRSQLGRMGNVLVSGHKNGVAHLTILPDSNAKDTNAEILKRYNHAKHLPKASHASRSRSLRIRNLELTSPQWSCCVPSSIFSLCADHIYLWEPNRSDVPLVMQKTNSTNTLGLCNDRDGIYALGRKRGVCIRDIRVRDRVNSGLKPPVDNEESVSLVKWNPHDGGNQLAAVHDRTTIKIWDIRSKQPLATYNRHADTVNSLEWSSRSELVSASADGTVRVWDVASLENDVEPLHLTHNPSSKRNLDQVIDLDNMGSSSWNNYVNRLSMDTQLEGFAHELLSGDLPVNQNRQFSAMTLAQMGPSVGALTIDQDSFLGVHELGEIPTYNSLPGLSLGF